MMTLTTDHSSRSGEEVLNDYVLAHLNTCSSSSNHNDNHSNGDSSLQLHLRLPPHGLMTLLMVGVDAVLCCVVTLLLEVLSLQLEH